MNNLYITWSQEKNAPQSKIDAICIILHNNIFNINMYNLIIIILERQ